MRVDDPWHEQYERKARQDSAEERPVRLNGVRFSLTELCGFELGLGEA